MTDIVQEFLKQCLCLDIESTGLSPLTEDIVELGVHRFKDGEFKTDNILFGSNEPIPYAASAVNNISRRMIEGKPTFTASLKEVDEILDLGSYPFLVAHNIKYDRTILESNVARVDDNKFAKNNRWICSFRLSKQLYKPKSQEDTLSYALGYLRYFLDANVPDEMSLHRAGDDAYLCAKILEKMVEEIYTTFKDDIHSVEDLGNLVYQLSSMPIIYEILPIGKKYKGELLSDIAKKDAQYLLWVLESVDTLQPDNVNYDNDLAISIHQALEASLEE